MSRNIPVAVAISLALSACGSSKPSEDEIRSTLSERVDVKGCATSALFNNIPIKQERIGYNQSIIDAIIAANLIKKSGDTYELTDLGKSAYDADYKGFCYTDKYVIKDIAVVKQEDKNALSGTSLSDAWYVSFTISPSSVSEWVKTPQIIENAKKDSMTNISDTQNYTVLLAKKAGDEKLFIADQRFSFHPGISFHMGF
ncbi:MAG: hypothetical protein QM599_01300 [Pseudoxanthomonas sp.]